MKTYNELMTEIDQIRQKLKETHEDATFTAGPLRDVFRIVGPMMLDQIALIEEVLEFANYQLDSAHSEMMSRTDPRLYSQD